MKKKPEQDSLEDLLKDVEAGDYTEDAIKKRFKEDLLPENLRKVISFDYASMKQESENSARILITTLIDFYFENEDKNIKYIEKRKDLDILLVSNIIFQMKTSEYAITKLLELIDQGSINGKLFDSLSQLQRANSEMVKHLVMTEMAIENGYKSIWLDMTQKIQSSQCLDPNQEVTPLLSAGKPTTQIATGTKKFLKHIFTDEVT